MCVRVCVGTRRVAWQSGGTRNTHAHSQIYRELCCVCSCVFALALRWTTARCNCVFAYNTDLLVRLLYRHTHKTHHTAHHNTPPHPALTRCVCVCARVFSISGLWHDLMRWSCGIRAAARILRGADAHTKQRMVTMIRSGRSDVNCLSPTREGSCPMGSR